MHTPIYYHAKGSGKPILLIHGWAMESRVWMYFMEEFSPAYRVISIDLRGHGKSAALPGPYDFTTFAHDVIDTIESLQLKDITLIGWSMGVSVILKMFEHRMADVDSLVFISGTPSLTARDDYPHGLPRGEVHRLMRTIRREYPVGMKNFFERIFQGKDLCHPKREELYMVVCDMNKIPLQQVAIASLECLQNEDLRPSLNNMQIPALLIHGAHDRICLPGASQYMAEHLSSATLHMIKDTGHAPFLAEKEKVHRNIDQFIQNL